MSGVHNRLDVDPTHNAQGRSHRHRQCELHHSTARAHFFTKSYFWLWNATRMRQVSRVGCSANGSSSGRGGRPYASSATHCRASMFRTAIASPREHKSHRHCLAAW